MALEVGQFISATMSLVETAQEDVKLTLRQKANVICEHFETVEQVMVNNVVIGQKYDVPRNYHTRWVSYRGSQTLNPGGKYGWSGKGKDKGKYGKGGQQGKDKSYWNGGWSSSPTVDGWLVDGNLPWVGVGREANPPASSWNKGKDGNNKCKDDKYDIKVLTRYLRSPRVSSQQVWTDTNWCKYRRTRRSTSTGKAEAGDPPPRGHTELGSVDSGRRDQGDPGVVMVADCQVFAGKSAQTIVANSSCEDKWYDVAAAEEEGLFLKDGTLREHMDSSAAKAEGLRWLGSRRLKGLDVNISWEHHEVKNKYETVGAKHIADSGTRAHAASALELLDDLGFRQKELGVEQQQKREIRKLADHGCGECLRCAKTQLERAASAAEVASAATTSSSGKNSSGWSSSSEKSLRRRESAPAAKVGLSGPIVGDA
ncbi:hypothetical protein N9L68_05570 [bacterium]|nr:hypothetical protein [bacterium]